MRDVTLWDSNDQFFEAVTALRKTGKQIFLVTTGSTGGLLEVLWGPLHASNQLLGHRFCYAQEELEQFLGFKPKKFCSEETAAHMAAHAYWHGMELAVRRGISVPDMIGVGMTSSVSSDRHHRGDERVCIAVRTREHFFKFEATFEKCAEDASLEDRYFARIKQSQLADMMTLNVILEAAGCKQILFSRNGLHQGDFAPEPGIGGVTLNVSEWANTENRIRMDAGETAEQQTELALVNPSIYGRLYQCELLIDHDHAAGVDRSNVVLMSGSYNPLHHGHLKLARTIEEMTGKRVVFEITNTHPDKGRIPDAEMMRRADQFLKFAPVLLTDNAPLFIDKARRYPGVPMVIGADVMQGILDTRHYGGRLKNLFDVLDEFDRLGTVFYVNGRYVNELFLTRDDVAVPKKYEHLFLAVSGRVDISSSELRAKENGPQHTGR